MKRTLVARMVLCLLMPGLLAGCSAGEPAGDGSASPDHTSPATSEPGGTPTPSASEPDDPPAPSTPAAADASTTEAAETTEPTEAPVEPAEELFSATTLSGSTELTVTVPAGFTAIGVEDAAVEFDVITVTRQGATADDPWHQAVFSDTNVGLDAAGTRDSYLTAGEAADSTESITDLEPVTVDGVEFVGFEMVSQAPSGRMRAQWWFGDLSDTVLAIYFSTTHGDDEIPQELIGVRDSLTIRPAG